MLEFAGPIKGGARKHLSCVRGALHIRAKEVFQSAAETVLGRLDARFQDNIELTCLLHRAKLRRSLISP